MSYMNDKRGSPRVDCELIVEYGVENGLAQRGRMANIGIRGALLMTEAATPPAGTVLLLRFQLPLSRRPVKTYARVKWASLRRIGVEFVHLTFQEQEEIWRFYARESAWQRDLEP